MKRDIGMPGNPGADPPEPAGVAGSSSPAAPPSPEKVTVRDKSGGGIIAHRYGVSFVESSTALTTRENAEQMVEDFPDRFEIV